MKAIVLILIVTLAGAGAWYYRTTSESPAFPVGDKGQSAGARQPTLVVVARAEYREITDSIESIGTTYANESVTITSKVTDTVNLVHFDDGDYVEAGKILVEMTNREESALLAEAQANLDEARRQLSRQEDLGTKGLTSQSAIDEATSRVEAAEARFNAITARMNDRLIRAPFSGVLGFREISPGTLLTQNTAITTLDDITFIKLDFSIPEIYLGVVGQDYSIIARSEAWKDHEFNGTITTIGSRVDPVTRAVTVRALIENDGYLLRPGMLLTLSIITDIRQSLVVRESALMQIGDSSFVFIAGKDNMAHKQPVKVGARKFGYVEIVEGLNSGDMIVIEGGFKLQDGAPYETISKPAPSNREISGSKEPSAWSG